VTDDERQLRGVNPIPVKAAMALMGLLEPVYRLPMAPPASAI
jgi:4-hydroxy-tetrahydrodipicolinate synthase